MGVVNYQGDEFTALLAAVCASPGNTQLQLILRDWLLDHDAPEPVADEAVPRRPLSLWDGWSFGSGSGIGIGRGRGSGRGSGSGIGSGIGRGSGRGIGRGRGRGSGIGIGIGRGSGIGIGIGSEPWRIKPMRKGQAYLIHCGDWHTFCGRVVEQIGPSTYEMENVSKISETNNGDCWHDLAAGDKELRAKATYQHYTTRAVIPLVIAAFEWAGKLPQEF